MGYDRKEGVRQICNAECTREFRDFARSLACLIHPEPKNQQACRRTACQGGAEKQKLGRALLFGNQQNDPRRLKGGAAADAPCTPCAKTPGAKGKRHKRKERSKHAGKIKRRGAHDRRCIGCVGEQHENCEKQRRRGQRPVEEMGNRT